MKKLLGVLVVAATVVLAVVGVGCSSQDKYNVYEIDHADAGYTEYNIVHYDSRSNYKDDVLTGYTDESHFQKSSWTESEVKAYMKDLYEGAESMSFVSTNVTDEGDYYCCIVKFDDLDLLDNLNKLQKEGVLFSSVASGQSDKLVDAGFFQTSIKTQGGKQLDESAVEKANLHFAKSDK